MSTRYYHSGPSGFAAASISSVIKAWGGHGGLGRDHLPHISDTYFKRSNLMVSFIRRYVPAEAMGCLDGSGGMFLWVRLQVEYHPQLCILSPEEISDKEIQTLIGEKIMVAPSSYFEIPGGPTTSPVLSSSYSLISRLPGLSNAIAAVSFRSTHNCTNQKVL
ncbi:hypothetical protein I308_101376 [Cryptococcus tetragattii IND107]|uniref:Uncharacterized protein n=1 Tax=Cryptococcus tetragattii IND107 TaxID=1296105 RepID=A0ABR3C031_9TREE